jgi:hypothetical protein
MRCWFAGLRAPGRELPSVWSQCLGSVEAGNIDCGIRVSGSARELLVTYSSCVLMGQG